MVRCYSDKVRKAKFRCLRNIKRKDSGSTDRRMLDMELSGRRN